MKAIVNVQDLKKHFKITRYQAEKIIATVKMINKEFYLKNQMIYSKTEVALCHVLTLLAIPKEDYYFFYNQSE